MTRIHKLAPYLLVGALTIGGKALIAQAAEEPIAGINITLHELYQNKENAEEEIMECLQEQAPSIYDKLAFAQVRNYVNIRSDASEKSEIIGKLYNNAAATIIAKKEDWYQIKSGSVAGYIKSDYLVTGDKAEKLAKSQGTRIAKVNTTTLKVRAEASTASEILTLIPIGDEFQVLKELEGWVKISLNDNKTGYVSSDYVKLLTVYEEAVSIEEEQERLEEEAAANSARQEAASSSSSRQTSSTGSSKSSSNTSSSNTSSSKTSSSSKSSSSTQSSSLGSKIADYATQFVGNPYVWGGTSLTRGADCSGFTQSVYAHYGISIPRTSRTQATGGSRVSISNLKKGDLVFYAKRGTINHVAIYIGNGKVISASSPKTGIRISSLYYRDPVKAVRYID